MAGLYIHIPYCKRKCRYCDFVSYAGRDDFLAYSAALITEMRLLSPMMQGRSFESVYIGGGTPTLLPAGLIGRILSEVRACFAIGPEAEITCECNPESVTEAKLSDMRAAGINRLSLGMQSADDAVLSRIGRIHDAEQAKASFALAKSCGFSNINIDIMHGLPGQTIGSYLDTIRTAAQLGASHISSYALILEEGTPLYDDVIRGKVELPDEDETADMEDAGFDLLEKLGYERYEISNFARPGCRCLHNLNYWNNGDYLGIGVNSHSALHINGKWVRFANRASVDEYIQDLGANKLPIAETQQIEREEEMFECIMMGLRKTDGVDRGAFTARFGIDPVEQYAAAISAALLDGTLVVDEKRFYLTKRGLDFQNEILLNFM